MKKILFHIQALMFPALIGLGAVASSCNSKTEPTEEVAAVTISTVAVKDFTLQANNKVLTNLDSVFFSIDLNNGVIFNADSLPVGTNVTRLIPVITFSTTMSKADIVMHDGEKTDTIDYLTNKTDSVDFSKRVTLDVSSWDGSHSYTYLIKVNVHTQKPDSMMWDNIAVSTLPSRMAQPLQQKSVELSNEIISIIEEADKSLTLSKSSDIFKGEWTKSQLSLPFTPQISSLTATPAALWMLDEGGNLYTSTDGAIWDATGQSGWTSIIGAYLDSVLGLKNTDTGLTHCHYPANVNIEDPELDPEFPLYGRSALLSLSNKWTPQPTAVFVGGTMANGQFSDQAWAFDGSTWVALSNEGLPAIDGASMVRYVYYRNTSVVNPGDPREIWYVFGGRLSDGSFNRTAYFSGDNGVSWHKASELMQLPDYFPLIAGADVLVMAAPKSADLSDAWSKTRTRSYSSWLQPEYEIEGTDISWQCPYIYIIGGITPQGDLSDAIWRGILARLRFVPII